MTCCSNPDPHACHPWHHGHHLPHPSRRFSRPGNGPISTPSRLEVQSSSEQEASGRATASALDAQQQLLAESLKVNTAMAWLQLALGIAGKVSGR